MKEEELAKIWNKIKDERIDKLRDDINKNLKEGNPIKTRQEYYEGLCSLKENIEKNNANIISYLKANPLSNKDIISYVSLLTCKISRYYSHLLKLEPWSRRSKKIVWKLIRVQTMLQTLLETMKQMKEKWIEGLLGDLLDEIRDKNNENKNK